MDLVGWLYLVGPFLLVAGLSLAWALAEVVQTFASDVRRALRTGWTWLFLAMHVVSALGAYVLTRALFSQVTSPWRLALLAGIGWEALLRTRVNLLQPIEAGSEGVPLLSLVELYSRFQKFCRTQIDQALISERILLLERATRLDEETLEQQVRLQQYASMLGSPDQVETFLQKVRAQQDETKRKLLLASYLLQSSGFDSLQAWLDRQEGRGSARPQ